MQVRPPFLTDRQLAPGQRIQSEFLHSITFNAEDPRGNKMIELVNNAKRGEMSFLPVPKLGELFSHWPAEMNLVDNDPTTGDRKIIIPIGRERKRVNYAMH